MNIFRSTHTQSDAVAKIAHLTSVFERLVAQAGVQRGRIEQMLAEMAEDRNTQCVQPGLERRAA
jgi:hypothetical protein